MAARPHKTDSEGARPTWVRLLDGLFGRSGAKPEPPVKPSEVSAEKNADVKTPIRAEVAAKPASSPDQQREEEFLEGAREFEGALLGSSDAFAAAKDYAGHATGPFHGFVTPLLAATNTLDSSDLGRVDLIKLARSGRWWARTRQEQVPEQYDAMIALETALNVSRDLVAEAERNGEIPGTVTVDEVCALFARTSSLEPSNSNETQVDKGEWSSRLGLARYLEDLAAPTRILADFQMDVAGHVAVVDIEVMRPAALKILGLGGQRDVTREARAYAYRLCLLAGKAAFACAEGLTRVVVNGREAQTDYPLLSLDLARAGLDALLTEANKPQAELPPHTLGIRFQDNGTGWFEPVLPFAERKDELVNPPARWDPPEMSDEPCPPAVRDACHAKTWQDLGINEKAVRVAAWNEMAPNLGITTRQSVSRLMEMREATRDVSVAAACGRASEALVAGTVDATDKQGLALLFVDGSDLAQVVEAAGEVEAAAVSEDAAVTYDELSETVAALQDALAPFTTTGAYLDDSDNVYRYFNSMAERVRFNEMCCGEKRHVHLVPDEYYAANARASRMLCALERPHEALVFAEEAVRLAPVCCDAALTKVRCLEAGSRLYEASEILVAHIKDAVSANDLAICFYRLAFMQWRLARPRVAAACYLRAVDVNRDLAGRIKQELGQLMAAEGADIAPQGEAEVREVLASANIPFGDVEKIHREALLAAEACVDAQAFSVAQPLVGVAVQARHDDALMRVYRSLAAPMPEGYVSE